LPFWSLQAGPFSTNITPIARTITPNSCFIRTSS
jgi:hypothetical protein